MEDGLLNVEMTLARIPVSRSTLFVLMKSGRLRYVKIGQRRFVTESAVQDFLAGLEAERDTG